MFFSISGKKEILEADTEAEDEGEETEEKDIKVSGKEVSTITMSKKAVGAKKKKGLPKKAQPRVSFV